MKQMMIITVSGKNRMLIRIGMITWEGSAERIKQRIKRILMGTPLWLIILLANNSLLTGIVPVNELLLTRTEKQVELSSAKLSSLS